VHPTCHEFGPPHAGMIGVKGAECQLAHRLHWTVAMFWTPPSDDYSQARAQMVERQLRRRGVRDERVLSAMAIVPRHVFLPPEFQAVAYSDSALPIGHGQTISQPLMVALMLERAELRGDERVLDVGTGSGYQAALLTLLASDVISIEIDPVLAQGAKHALAAAGVSGVRVVVGDGSLGYMPEAPYDVILVAAAAPTVPVALVEQLAEGGRLLVPVGPQGFTQELVRVRKRKGRVEQQNLGGCLFVPLVVPN
jgi:protein-L-isoaspartate(D-aspartate) O-methyltransferase